MVKEIICKTDGAAILVDDEDYPVLSRFPWYRGGRGRHPMTFLYGKRDTSQTVYMHQLIMGGAVNADHIDHDVCNMQKSNLRPSNPSLNGANARKMQWRSGKPCASQYKGVTWSKQTNKWRAGITKDKKKYNLGEYSTEERAALAYNAKAKELFGEYAYLNEVPEINHHARAKGSGVAE